MKTKCSVEVPYQDEKQFGTEERKGEKKNRIDTEYRKRVKHILIYGR